MQMLVAMLVLVGMVSAGGSGSAAGAAAAGVMGDWIGPTQSIVRIHPCGDAVCAQIVKLSAGSPEKTDGNNPKAELRGRALCGLEIGTGFREIDPSHLQFGHFYDPKNGRTYQGTITADGDNLNLRGFVGISLLGRTEVWHRVAPADAKKCGA